MPPAEEEFNNTIKKQRQLCGQSRVAFSKCYRELGKLRVVIVWHIIHPSDFKRRAEGEGLS